MRWLRKNKLQLKQGSFMSEEASGQYEKTWSRCADCLRCSHALQPLCRRSLGPPVVPELRKLLIVLVYSASRVPANHDIDLFSEIF